MTITTPDIEALKASAKAMRRETGMAYGRALDLVAQKVGYRDWNSACALTAEAAQEFTKRKLRNRAVLEIVLGYRLQDCMELQENVILRFKKDHPDWEYNEEYLRVITSVNPLELACRSNYPAKWPDGTHFGDFIPYRASRFDRPSDGSPPNPRLSLLYRWYISSIYMKSTGVSKFFMPIEEIRELMVRREGEEDWITQEPTPDDRSST